MKYNLCSTPILKKEVMYKVIPKGGVQKKHEETT